MFLSGGVAPSFASRASQKAANNIASNNLALKRKRDDIILPRSAPASRGSNDSMKMRELGDISQYLRRQNSVAEGSNMSRTAKLLSSGDVILSSGGEISLILNAVHPVKGMEVHSIVEDFVVSDLDRDMSVSAATGAGAGASRGLIASSNDGIAMH